MPLVDSAAKINYDRKIPATSPSVSVTGRYQPLADGSVSFDWSGVYLQTVFTGGTVAVEISDTKHNYFNVFIDGKWKDKIETHSKNPTRFVLASGMSNAPHVLRLQKCTEGSEGCATVRGFFLSPKGTMKAVPAKERKILFIGDSYTCGYGVEAHSAKEHFQAATENCNGAYACIIARYFDADYHIVAHSGQGMARNYGDTAQVSSFNMVARFLRLFDEHGTGDYAFQGFQPSLVCINLGTNDFSPGIPPSPQQYAGCYMKMIHQILAHYGEVPVLCIIPHSASEELRTAIGEVRKRTSGMKRVFFTSYASGIVNADTELGADYHPNREGQRKLAMPLVPRIAAIMHWPMEKKTIK